jgi:hypothetical protein
MKNITLHLILERAIKQMLAVKEVTGNFKILNACMTKFLLILCVRVCGTVGVCAVVCCTYIDI